jgi:hypothetical protein
MSAVKARGGEHLLVSKDALLKLLRGSLVLFGYGLWVSLVGDFLRQWCNPAK